MKMSMLELVSIEWMKGKRSKMIPLIFVAPLLVVVSGVAGIRHYVTPDSTNVWAAMLIQSTLLFSYYLLPLSMVVICVMIAGRETGNNGILKMLALPVSRHALSAAKFCVLLSYLLMETAVFFAVFVIAGLFATASAGVTETLPIMDLLKWCGSLFLTMIPSVTVMWAITVLFETPLISVGINILLVISGLLMANTPLWFLYPYCYSGYLVSCSLHAVTARGIGDGWKLVPFLPCAIFISVLAFWVAITCFGKQEFAFQGGALRRAAEAKKA